MYIDQEILLTFTFLLCVFTTARSMYLRRVLVRKETILDSALTSLEAAQREVGELRQMERRFQDFKASLNQAEIATKMQTPRLELNRRGTELRMPERYQYVHSLAEKGLPAAEIASILTISHHEADQLVALANLSRKSTVNPQIY